MPTLLINGRLVDLEDGAAFLEAARGDELPDEERVLLALHDTRQAVAIQLSRADCRAVAAALGQPDIEPGVIVAALRRLGADRVFDAGFAADLAVMETAAELLHRLHHAAPLPLIAGGCPRLAAVAARNPALRPHLSTCRTPQQMHGSLVKNYYAGSRSLPPDRVCGVAVASCPALHAEAQRLEFSYHGLRDVDAVLTPGALASLLRRHEIDVTGLAGDPFNAPYGLSSGCADTAEAVLRAAWFLETGDEWQGDVAGLTLAGTPVRAVTISDVGEIRRGLASELIVARACPAGCVTPDKSDGFPHQNAAIRQIYRSVLEAPGSDIARLALHAAPAMRPVEMPVMPPPRSAAGR